MPTITLADIQKAADKKYGPLIIKDVPGGPVTLVNPLRLPKEKRDAMTALDDVEDVDVKLRQLVELAASPDDAKRLLDAVGDDLAALAEIVADYTGTAQVGEA
jgi:hypothetical protein